uniref:Tetratricopeptide repeat protein n=1 Tax=Magallana gigas TaxID=29159 RepID=K1Q7N3_MAGGI
MPVMWYCTANPITAIWPIQPGISNIFTLLPHPGSNHQTATLHEKEALDDLEFLVHHDQGQFVPEQLRDISWEILGICQQMAGNFQDARYSYQQSLEQDHTNQLEHATRQRILELNS